MRKNSTTIRISWELRDKLQAVSKVQNESMQTVIEKAIDRYGSQCRVVAPLSTTTPVVPSVTRQLETQDGEFRKLKAREAMEFQELTSTRPLKR